MEGGAPCPEAVRDCWLTARQWSWTMLRGGVRIGVIHSFPLAAGILTGKYRRGEPFPPDSRLAALPVSHCSRCSLHPGRRHHRRVGPLEPHCSRISLSNTSPQSTAPSPEGQTEQRHGTRHTNTRTPPAATSRSETGDRPHDGRCSEEGMSWPTLQRSTGGYVECLSPQGRSFLPWLPSWRKVTNAG
jgi:hypothetical protein